VPSSQIRQFHLPLTRQPRGAYWRTGPFAAFVAFVTATGAPRLLSSCAALFPPFCGPPAQAFPGSVRALRSRWNRAQCDRSAAGLRLHSQCFMHELGQLHAGELVKCSREGRLMGSCETLSRPQMRRNCASRFSPSSNCRVVPNPPIHGLGHECMANRLPIIRWSPDPIPTTGHKRASGIISKVATSRLADSTSSPTCPLKTGRN
jgi:hypothetical protein